MDPATEAATKREAGLFRRVQRYDLTVTTEGRPGMLPGKLIEQMHAGSYGAALLLSKGYLDQLETKGIKVLNVALCPK